MIREMPTRDQVATDPVLMLILTAQMLQRQFGL
jgi:hypothetical protein